MHKQLEDALDRLRSGDFRSDQDRERCFRVLFDAWFPCVFGFLKSKGLSDEDARDLSQEVLFNVHGNIAQLDSNRVFASWLYTAVQSVLQAGPGEFDFLDELTFDDRGDLLREALEPLSPQTRQCLRIQMLEDADSATIAKRVGIPVSAVKAHLLLAKRALRARLGELRQQQQRNR